MTDGGEPEDLSARQAATVRWLSVCAFLNACTWSVSSTAQTGLGMQLAPSRAHLLAMMSALVSLSAVLQFVLLPVAGKISDTFGRKATMLVRSVVMCAFPATLALRPSYVVFCAQRLITNMTYPINQAANDAMLADMFEGEALASALGAELLTLEGAGHNNVLSNPHWARFANRLQGFLKECRAK